MRAWTSPEPGTLPGSARGPAVRVFDSSTRALREVDAIERRSERLLAKGRFPVPAGGWPSIPWPPF